MSRHYRRVSIYLFILNNIVSGKDTEEHAISLNETCLKYRQRFVSLMRFTERSRDQKCHKTLGVEIHHPQAWVLTAGQECKTIKKFGKSGLRVFNK